MKKREKERKKESAEASHTNMIMEFLIFQLKKHFLKQKSIQHT